jgi:polyisoprenoid-binding protein YceI
VKRVLWLALALVVLVVGGTWTYINVIKEDAPERLTLQQGPGADQNPSGDADGVEGVWKATTGSQAGYRVKEVLFGQSTEGVGRTSNVTGSITIAGTEVTEGSFTVDMASVTSDESRRDNQFRGRIMDVGNHPTSTFQLTQPIALGEIPADGQPITRPAAGKLTLRGTTRDVTFDVEAQRTGPNVKVAGAIPIVFAEWGIPNPSFGPAQTEDRGVLEFLLVLAR